MNIGIDIRPLLDSRYSGVAVYTLEIVRALLRNDAHNHYTLFYNAFRGPAQPLPEFTGAVRTVGWRYPNKLLNYGGFRWLNRPSVDKALGVDVFFMPHFNFIGLKEAPSVGVIHDLSFWRHPEYFSARQNVWHNAINIRRWLRRQRHVIAVSEHTKRDLVDLAGVPASKISVIYSGLDPAFRPLAPTDPAISRVRERYRLREGYLLYLGNLEPRKNVEGIIEAYTLYRRRHAARTPAPQLVIAGSRAWKYNGIVRAHAASPYREDIVFLDYVDAADRPALYSAARVFLFPSFYEGFGFPPLEAMACGTPAIVSNLSALPEIAGRGALACNPHDLEELAFAMETLLHDQAAHETVRTAGLEWVKRYNWDTAAGKVLDALQKVV